MLATTIAIRCCRFPRRQIHAELSPHSASHVTLNRQHSHRASQLVSHGSGVTLKAPVVRRVIAHPRTRGGWKMSKSILVPLDGSAFSEGALSLALNLAEKVDAAVKLVHVHPRPVLLHGGPAYDLQLDRDVERGMGRD